MAYRQMWEIEISHSGLNKYRHIRGSDQNVVEQKASAQKAVWEEMWQKKLATEQKRQEKERLLQNREQKKKYAEQRTAEAAETIDSLENTLNHTLKIDDTVDWESLKNKLKFEVPPPNKVGSFKIPIEPLEGNDKYHRTLSILDKIFSNRKKQKLQEAADIFKGDHDTWIRTKSSLEKNNIINENKYKDLYKKWEQEKVDYYQKKEQYNRSIDLKKKEYFDKAPESIFEYCDMVLTNSDYPDFFPKEFNIDYNPENGILIVDYSLPSIEDIPTLKEVKYIQTKDEYKESFLSDAVFNKLYDSLLYQLALRTVHELFEADVVDALQSIVFNGWVESTDKGTGKKVTACILTVQVNKEEFIQINLEYVDPKICFKNLKGVGSSKLHSLTPVAPILQIDKEDKRFVSSYNVADELNESINLAAMDWEDFEHLVRELFAKEFTESGGEVRVTRASRDGGVDAIAFDPDPIRGGKIVIQAKRYTNVVGVSAVRDLYGTVMNEGAMKGILITTADYGPDSYSFARGKPLTLLNGSNLLHLLEKHGTKAKIDLKEAKMILSENQDL